MKRMRSPDDMDASLVRCDGKDERTVCRKSKCRFASYEWPTCGKSSHLAEGTLQRKNHKSEILGRVFSFVQGKRKFSTRQKTPLRNESRFQTRDMDGRGSSLFLASRITNQLPPVFFRVWIYPVVSGAVSVWRPDLSGRSAVSRSCGCCQVQPFSIASALDVPGLGHVETQKPGVFAVSQIL